MSEILVESTQPAESGPPAADGFAEPRGERVAWTIWSATVLILCAAVTILSNFFPLEDRYAPPVILGVQAEIKVYEDDSGSDIEAALTEGVTAVGGEDRPDETFPVRVSVLDASGEAVSEYLPGTYRLRYSSDDGDGREAEPVESVLTVKPADTEGPVFEGLQDREVMVGETVSYREGVTATDNADGTVRFQINAEQVNLQQPGQYSVIYSASDKRGNETVAQITITVIEPAPPEEDEGSEGKTERPEHVSAAVVHDMADRILAQITTPEMSLREKARAIFNYVSGAVHYSGWSDKSSWITGAYVGLLRGSGDCFNYFAVSKELLTRAGIPNIDLQRVGGGSNHYWQLVNVGDGWYHFDTCPHPNGNPITCFLLTEAQVRAYSARFTGYYGNYYVYDYDSCPVVVEGTPEGAPAGGDAGPDGTDADEAEPEPDAEAEPEPESDAEAEPEPAQEESAEPPKEKKDRPEHVSATALHEIADRVLERITAPEMSLEEKALAIYDYVHGHIRYTGWSDKSHWITGAYVGLTQGAGDCFNYFATSKELLTRAGIPNIDLQRAVGPPHHYWQLINVGDGWYHFDTCYHPTGYNYKRTFMMTEAEARAFSAQFTGFYSNYYLYDYDSCPVAVVGTPEEELIERGLLSPEEASTEA